MPKILSINSYYHSISTVGTQEYVSETETITRVSNTSTAIPIITQSGWLTINVSISGTTLTLTGYNNGTTSHGAGIRVTVIEIE